MSRLLTTPDLYALLRRRALGEPAVDLAPDFGLTNVQVNGLIYTHKARLLAMCATLGVKPAVRTYRNRDPEKARPRPVDDSRLSFGASRKARVRRCLKCERNFPSDGPGNRVCGACKTSPAWRGGGDYDVHAGGRVCAPGAE